MLFLMLALRPMFHLQARQSEEDWKGLGNGVTCANNSLELDREQELVLIHTSSTILAVDSESLVSFIPKRHRLLDLCWL